MEERDWFIPCTMLTLLLGLAALSLMPVAGYSGIPPYFNSFIGWLSYSLIGAWLFVVVKFIQLAIAREPQPIRALRRQAVAAAGSMAFVAAGMTLAGIDMLFFMWIKPEVTAVAPFWADAVLADADRLVFGTDPWRLFDGIDLTFHAWAYSAFWAVAIMVTLMWLFAQPRSRARSTSILNYFLLWSVFGPLGQMLMSAAGPVFYARIGGGDRFEAQRLALPDVTARLSDYLWGMHVRGELGFGAGISAMPSLHIATTTWIALVFAGQRSRLTPLAILFVLYIWWASVALGWHYAVDGLAGGLGALMCHRLASAYFTYRGTAPAPIALAQPALR